MWIAALELSFWNFGAQGLINAGLLYSPAARASFLTQTSVVMTPLISALAGESIKSSVWGGCALALVGLFLISTSSSASDVSVGDAVSSFNQGDAMILLGALSWSTYIFRTSKMASNYSELDLQYTKTVLLAVMYGGWFVTNVVSTLSSAGTSFLSAGWLEALTPLWSGWMNPIVWILLTYSAVGPGAVADLLQQKGQKETSASESNIILCLESVFAAVCAFLLLGEVSSMREIFGGSMIVLAAVLASK
jgi:drug/metabolite transporter (DMT)-like permease